MYGNVELETVSEVHFRRLLGTTIDPNISLAMGEEDYFCKLILYKEIADSRQHFIFRVRIWDVVILIPNLIFLIFIAARFNRARLKLRATSSPIYLAFYGLVVSNILISVIRCVVSMTVNAAATVGGLADKILWVTVRFFLLSTEMSVVIFGLAFGHLDSRSSIRRVLLATSFIALAFTITQGTLELVLPDDTFEIPSRKFYLFGHGGMMFWFCSSLVFTTIYFLILILPRTRLRDRLALPTKRSFYVYAGILAFVDLLQSIGAGLLNYMQAPEGLCIVDITAALYLTLFTPLVYHTFLSELFGVSQPTLMFSYKAQVDDAMDEDTVSLPHQQSFSSLKTDSDYIYQVHTPFIHMPLFDSTLSKSSSISKHRSNYSLAAGQVLVKNWSGKSISQVELNAGSTSKGLDERQRALKTGYKSSLTFPKLKYSPLSTPNLNVCHSALDLKSDLKNHQDVTSVSNYTLSPTASNLIYSPECRDSNVNLFSPSNDNDLKNFPTETKSTANITSVALASETVDYSRPKSEIFKSRGLPAYQFFEQDAVVNSRSSVSSEMLGFDNADSVLHSGELQKRSSNMFRNYVGNLSESNLLLRKDKKPISINIPSTSINTALLNDEEFTNLDQIKPSTSGSKIESLNTSSKSLGQTKSTTSVLSIGNEGNLKKFSPHKQSSFKDQNFSILHLNPVKLETASIPDSQTLVEDSEISSFASAQSQNTDLSFFSANNSFDNTTSDVKISNSSLQNSKSTTSYSFNNSDDNSKNSTSLSDYLKLFNAPPKHTD
ncbi:uncharacterized protein LOC124297381 isoform X1 [Neodiprion virginianus]|uniref:uncharacterized protein LOC124297381 isoform X1 n=1 Tax=Neodiprion virginianus TaxID=2961670 RepID=UPI001EE6AAB8|nr:uncharacterized protein LOC124297381 isoform X1 [Neodiprion virginianus]XP_046604316.1 uncharacterized protein LOC124297381 isoform X1 [Neodiprion virginianus]